MSKLKLGTGLAALLMICIACQQAERPTPAVPGGAPSRGLAAIQAYGCGACHTIGGVAGAHSRVGPDLSDIRERAFIAGQLANEPDNLIEWIQHPQEIKPGDAMPDLGVTAGDARDIAAFLYAER